MDHPTGHAHPTRAGHARLAEELHHLRTQHVLVAAWEFHLVLTYGLIRARLMHGGLPKTSVAADTVSQSFYGTEDCRCAMSQCRDTVYGLRHRRSHTGWSWSSLRKLRNGVPARAISASRALADDPGMLVHTMCSASCTCQVDGHAPALRGYAERAPVSVAPSGL